MRLTNHTDYGLRVLIYLALQGDSDVSTADIAAYHKLSLHHIRKIVQGLSHAGFVDTTRGRGGGVRLARPAVEIRLGQVVLALEPDMNIAECFRPGTSSCVIAPVCRLKAVLADARAAFLDELDQVTLAEVVGNGRALRRLLNAEAEGSSG
ncbi:MAG: Rrf2 family nitric oxide-sensitive transcriptional repressor [Myxococcota bacterium]|jgi:Rrf2 family nitric oxide-sensitive transcriptional repressor